MNNILQFMPKIIDLMREKGLLKNDSHTFILDNGGKKLFGFSIDEAGGVRILEPEELNTTLVIVSESGIDVLTPETVH
jgi:hypothetical protein